MTRFIPLIVLFGWAAHAFTEDRLPQPDFHRQPSDPAWLATVVQFHGHLGPSVVAGARMGMAAAFSIEPEEVILAYSLNNQFPFNFARPAGQLPGREIVARS